MTALEATKPDYLTLDELQDQINTLQKADLFRLSEIAGKYVGGHELSAYDLLQEAICRVLAGERKSCPRNLSIIGFLAGIMKSIAFDKREEAKHLIHYENNSDWDKFQVQSDNQEIMLIDKEQKQKSYEALEVLFNGDDESFLMLLHLQDGYSAHEIREAENWSKTQYNTIRKRIRRKVNSSMLGEKL